MLDMDGTVLDLAYDNYMWLTHVPERYAEKHGMSLTDARNYLFGKYGAMQGELSWYCLDHWSERLELDVIQLHRNEHHRIDYLPGAREFLETVRKSHVRLLLVTNSHPDTLELKDEVTGLTQFFDGIHSSHTYGYAKERREFWQALQEETRFDTRSTMFVSMTVTRSCRVPQVTVFGTSWPSLDPILLHPKETAPTSSPSMASTNSANPSPRRLQLVFFFPGRLRAGRLPLFLAGRR